MGLWDEVRRGFVAKRAEIAAQKEQSRALVPVIRGQLVPTAKPGALIELQSPPPAARRGRDLLPAKDPQTDVTGYNDGGEIVAAAPLFRFEAWCSRSGRPFVAVAERHGNALILLGSEKPDGSSASSAFAPGYEYYRIDAAPGWACPWCGVREDAKHDFLRLLWACTDPACGEPLHCCGNKRGVFRCACGQIARRKFQRAGVFKVYEYEGLRGPDGRGSMCGCPRPDGGVAFALYTGASTGSLLRRR